MLKPEIFGAEDRDTQGGKFHGVLEVSHEGFRRKDSIVQHSSYVREDSVLKAVVKTVKM